MNNSMNPVIAESDQNISRRQIITSSALSLASLATAGGLGNQVINAQSTANSDARTKRFEGRAVLITGATSGIGRTTAIAFAREGARVAFCGRREREGAETERLLREAGGTGKFIRADVQKARDVEALVSETIKLYGKLDIAFNNAGIGGALAKTETTSEEI